MRRALRTHLRDVLAIIGLILAGLFAVTVILVNQRAVLPSWVPLIGTDRFELKADFSTAQAVTPGQGQSVDIAGIKVGEVSSVTLQDGHAVVGMEIDNKYAPLIHTNSSLLLRPKTGLNDMVVEVDPGTQSAPEVKEGSTIPLSSTQPQVNPDEILASLDADTQQFLKLLLANGAEALDPATGRDVKLSNALRRLDPFARDIGRISGALATRRLNIANSIHNFQLLSTELGNRDQDLVNFVDSSNAVLASFAKEQASIRSAVRELPATLKEAKGALTSANNLALQSGPALKKSIPGAKATRPGAARAASVLPADRGADPEPDPAVHAAGRQPGHPPGADLAGPREGLTRPAHRLHEPELRAQRPRLQPARGPGGLPLLRPVAEPRPERGPTCSRTPTGRSAAASSWRAAAPPGSLTACCGRSPTCACSTSSPGSPRSANIPGCG